MQMMLSDVVFWPAPTPQVATCREIGHIGASRYPQLLVSCLSGEALRNIDDLVIKCRRKGKCCA